MSRPCTAMPAVRHPSRCFVSLSMALLMLLGALGFSVSAESVVVYRWVDKQGNTHFGDAVPSEYKDVAKPLDNTAASPSAEAQRRATELAARQKERARAADALKAAASSAAGSSTGMAASSPTAPRRPAHAPTEDTDCETWRRLYRESLDCFGPYRTARGATKAEAFDYCTPVMEPPQRCGRDGQ